MKSTVKHERMIKNLLILAIVAIASLAGWYALKAKTATEKTLDETVKSQNEPTATPKNPSTATTTSPSASPKTSPKPDISKWNSAGFITASYSRKLTDFSPWEDSPVEATVKDFTGDGVNDVFVWAKLPGTNGYSFAAVWTVGDDNQPKELWYSPSAEVYVQSTWSVAGLTFIETGKLNTPGGLSDETNTYHWQGSKFVTI